MLPVPSRPAPSSGVGASSRRSPLAAPRRSAAAGVVARVARPDNEHQRPLNGWLASWDPSEDWFEREGQYIKDDEPCPWQVHLWRVVEGAHGPWPPWKWNKWDERAKWLPPPNLTQIPTPDAQDAWTWNRDRQERQREYARAFLERPIFRTVEDKLEEDVRVRGLEENFGLHVKMSVEEQEAINNPAGVKVQDIIDDGGMEVLSPFAPMDSNDPPPALLVPDGFDGWLRDRNMVIDPEDPRIVQDPEHIVPDQLMEVASPFLLGTEVAAEEEGWDLLDGDAFAPDGTFEEDYTLLRSQLPRRSKRRTIVDEWAEEDAATGEKIEGAEYDEMARRMAGKQQEEVDKFMSDVNRDNAVNNMNLSTDTRSAAEVEEGMVGASEEEDWWSPELEQVSDRALLEEMNDPDRGPVFKQTAEEQLEYVFNKEPLPVTPPPGLDRSILGA